MGQAAHNIPGKRIILSFQPMKSAPGLILIISIVAASPSSSQACGGHRARCHSHHHPSVAMISQPMASHDAMPMTYASPQMAQTPASMPVAPVAATAAPTTTAVAAVEPTYDYAAATSEQPAYYYTYDNSGKLIVAQWMDWVFRGGRAAVAPAPPLPIIGALRNR